jgi:hypothetical protein
MLALAALAVLAIAAQGLFIVSWLWAGAVEGHGYSAIRHDISDLGALTAHHASAFVAGIGVAGALTVVFAVAVLRPALEVGGLTTPIGSWLVALSLPALDNLADVFFRLDCRAADVACSSSDAVDSWHGTAHIAVFDVAAAATIAAPFALAARVRVDRRVRAPGLPCRPTARTPGAAPSRRCRRARSVRRSPRPASSACRRTTRLP